MSKEDEIDPRILSLVDALRGQNWSNGGVLSMDRDEAIELVQGCMRDAVAESSAAPSQPAPVVIPRAIDLPDAAREVMARYERSYHGSEVFPTLRMWDEVANVLASSNRPQATEGGGSDGEILL